MGAGIGAAAGAAAGLIGVLATRGPDAVLARGSTVEMVLDRPVQFQRKRAELRRLSAAACAPQRRARRAEAGTATVAGTQASRGSR